MEFTFIQKSIHGDRIYFPKKFFISTNAYLPTPFLYHLWTKEKQEEFKLAIGSAYSFTKNEDGKLEWEIWPVRCKYKNSSSNNPEIVIYYKNQKLKLDEFAWPGFRDATVMKEIFLQRFSHKKNNPSIQFELTEELLYKFLIKFQDSFIFSIPFGSEMKEEEFYIEEFIMDLVNMRPITLHHLKHEDSLNFILCANDFVSLLNSSVITVRERK